MHTCFCFGKLKERDSLEDLDIDGTGWGDEVEINLEEIRWKTMDANMVH